MTFFEQAFESRRHFWYPKMYTTHMLLTARCTGLVEGRALHSFLRTRSAAPSIETTPSAAVNPGSTTSGFSSA